ncbi:hypothetical protein, partial [Lawsonella sp.]|uniref:hypothetical protein n=1 Tax=Lawsonella sp. TaxID=2041415 RepID=UPI0025C002E9
NILKSLVITIKSHDHGLLHIVQESILSTNTLNTMNGTKIPAAPLFAQLYTITRYTDDRSSILR